MAESSQTGASSPYVVTQGVHRTIGIAAPTSTPSTHTRDGGLARVPVNGVHTGARRPITSPDIPHAVGTPRPRPSTLMVLESHTT